jgi:hypothetical protein
MVQQSGYVFGDSGFVAVIIFHQGGYEITHTLRPINPPPDVACDVVEAIVTIAIEIKRRESSADGDCQRVRVAHNDAVRASHLNSL